MRYAALLALLASCTPETEEKDPPPIPDGVDTEDTAAVCEGTAPRIEDLSADPDGLHELEQGQLYPTLIFGIQASDADGDLNFVRYELWWDQELDGAVDSSGAALVSGQASLSSRRCQSPTMALDLLLSSQGDPPWNTWCDFALRISDEAGLWSEPAVVQGAMPKEDGSDPDPMKGGS